MTLVSCVALAVSVASLRTVSVLGSLIPFIVKPFGPGMCVELCKCLNKCTTPVFSVHHLSCHLTDIPEMILSNEDYTLLKISKESKEVERNTAEHKNTRMIASRARELVHVHDEKRTASKVHNSRRGQSSSDRKKSSDKVCFNFEFDDINATVTSIARSSLCPNIIYILLKKQYSKQCTCAIRLLDMEVEEGRMLQSGLDCCKTDYKQEQILTGSCLTSKTRKCLYVLHVGLKMMFFKYKDPCSNTVMTPKARKLKIKGWMGGSLSCFLHRAVFICLRQLKLYSIRPKMGTLQPHPLPGRFSHHTSVRSMSIDSSFTFVVIVSSSAVSLLKFRFPKGTLYMVKDMSLTVQVTAWIKGTVLFHKGNIHDPIYKCSKHDVIFETCSIE